MEKMLFKLNINTEELICFLKLIFADHEEGVVKPILTTFNLVSKVKEDALKNFLILDISIQNEGTPK